MRNWQETLLAQYANSPTVTALIDFLNQCIDPTADIEAFYTTIWNVETAVGYGLDVWGAIVNVKRGVQAAVPRAQFGYNEAFSDKRMKDGVQPFNFGVFNDGSPPVVRNVDLDDDTYRTLILAKAMANITDCAVPSLNRLLRLLFAGRGRCYVLDTGKMTMQYVFEFDLTLVEIAMLTQSGVLPRPTGVLCNIIPLSGGTFGFSEAGPGVYMPFDQGVFFDSVINAS